MIKVELNEKKACAKIRRQNLRDTRVAGDRCVKLTPCRFHECDNDANGDNSNSNNNDNNNDDNNNGNTDNRNKNINNGNVNFCNS